MSILNKYEDKIKETLWEKTYPYVSEFVSKDEFNKTLNNIFDIMTFDDEQDDITLSDNCNKLYSLWRKNKYRWVFEDITIEDKNSPYYQEIFVIAKGLYDGPDGETKFREAYKVNTLSEYQQKIEEHLKCWRKEQEQSIFTYRYLKAKTTKQINFSLKTEMKYFILKEGLSCHEEELRPKDLLTQMSSLASFNFPVDSTNRQTFGSKKVVVKGRTYLINEYHVDDKSDFVSNLDITDLKTNALGSLLQDEKVINYTDFRILMFLVMKLIELGLSTREISTSIAEIRDSCGFAKNQHSNSEIKDSLRKLRHFTADFIIGEDTGFTYGFVDNLVYSIDKKNKSRLYDILMNQDIFNQLIQAKTISMYKSTVQKLKGKASLILIYKLQSERFSLHSKNKNNMKMEINYQYFRGAIRFQNKQIIRNIQVIEKALDEILETGVTLKSYKRVSDMFHLEFYPLTPSEQADLLPSAFKQNDIFALR